jgi:phospholipase/carboxylesterase
MMSKRRDFLLGAAAFLGGLSAACGKPRSVRSSVHAGIDFKELVHKEPDDALPIVVAIHGLGGAPEHWVDGWTNFPGRARIVLPRGFDKHEDGFSWFPWATNMKDPKLAADVGAAEEKLWKGVAALAGGKRVVVAGYTQGAILSFVMASRHPDAIVHAFPVVGACPEAFVPKEKTRAAPITAYHGTADDVLPIQVTRDAINAFKQQGNDALLREYAGVRHTATGDMHSDLNSDMFKALKPA